MKIAFLLYPTDHVKIDEDSSFWIQWELKKRGHSVSYFESRDLFWDRGRACARVRATRLDLEKGYRPSPLASVPLNLESLDCIFIRKEPPFDEEYLYALQILSSIKKQVFILNDPDGIALSNEKLAGLFSGAQVPESIVSSDVSQLRSFIKSIKRPVVIKPLNQKGGEKIVFTGPRDRNLPSLLHIATLGGKDKVLVQRFVSADKYGDKRILILDGNVLGAFLRRPPRHDFRANLSVGGTMHRASLTRSDRKIVEALTPLLQEQGLYFVGIDVIGDTLTEVNVTSPAGIPEINFFNKTHLERKVVDFLESRVGS